MLSRNESSPRGWSMKWLAAIVVALAAIMMFQPSRAFGQAKILDVHDKEPDFDSRTGKIAPTSTQLAIVSNLGADARWNRFGTPHSLIKHGGFLATGLTGDAVTAARNWIRANRALFRLSDQSVTRLELLNDSKMRGSNGHAVIFRQRFGNLPAAQDGITGGITRGRSPMSLLRVETMPLLCPGVVSAALDGRRKTVDGRPLRRASPYSVGRLAQGVLECGASFCPRVHEFARITFAALYRSGFSHPNSRSGRFPTTTRRTSGTRLLCLTARVETRPLTPFCGRADGTILFRQNLYHSRQVKPPARCRRYRDLHGAYRRLRGSRLGPKHSFNVPIGTQTIDVVASAAIITNDIVLKLFDPNDVELAVDTATSPEAIHYAPGGVITPGVYKVQVCPFEPPTVPHEPPYNYVGTFTTNDVAGASVRILRVEVLQAIDADASDTDTRSWGGRPAMSSMFRLPYELKTCPARRGIMTRAPTSHLQTRGNQRKPGRAQPADASRAILARQPDS